LCFRVPIAMGMVAEKLFGADSIKDYEFQEIKS